MSGFTIVFLGLVAAFNQVEILHFGSVKPFNCVKCLTGWYSFMFACIAHYGWQSLIFLPVGVFIGAMFEAIKMRWL